MSRQISTEENSPSKQRKNNHSKALPPVMTLSCQILFDVLAICRGWHSIAFACFKPSPKSMDCTDFYTDSNQRLCHTRSALRLLTPHNQKVLRRVAETKEHFVQNPARSGTRTFDLLNAKIIKDTIALDGESFRPMTPNGHGGGRRRSPSSFHTMPTDCADSWQRNGVRVHIPMVLSRDSLLGIIDSPVAVWWW